MSSRSLRGDETIAAGDFADMNRDNEPGAMHAGPLQPWRFALPKPFALPPAGFSMPVPFDLHAMYTPSEFPGKNSAGWSQSQYVSYRERRAHVAALAVSLAAYLRRRGLIE